MRTPETVRTEMSKRDEAKRLLELCIQTGGDPDFGFTHEEVGQIVDLIVDAAVEEMGKQLVQAARDQRITSGRAIR